MADYRTEFLCRHFFSRTDIVAVLAPWGTPCPALPLSLKEVVAGHVNGTESTIQISSKKSVGALRGAWRVGTYLSSTEGATSIVCIDVDGAGGEHHHPVENVKDATAAISGLAKSLGLAPIVESSGGGKGTHVWLFLAEQTPVATARKVGLACIPEGIKLSDGSPADVGRSRGVEVFPKTQTKSKVGSMVWLPWWHGAKPGGNRFIGEDGLEIAEPADTHIVRISKEKCEELASLVKEETREKKKSIKAEAAKQAGLAADFKAWRTAAVLAFPLDAIYGEWLTGKQAGVGWLECRDPYSPSGDVHPSAGVADGTGEAERGSFHTFRDSKTTSVFDFLMAKNQLSFRQAAELVAGISGVPLPAHSPEAPPDGRLQIGVGGRQLQAVILDTWKALARVNTPPFLFVRAGVVSRMSVVHDRRQVEPATQSAMFGQLVRAARWVTEKTDFVVDVPPPKDVAQDILDYPDGSIIPELDAIVQCPIFSDTELVTTRGYCAKSRLWVEETDGFVPASSSPTRDEALEAVQILLEAIQDFPFDDEGSRAHAIAMMICPFVRRMIRGCTPIHLIEAPTPGSGKGLLADVASLILTGQSVPVSTLSVNPEETRKRLTSILLRSSPVIMIDNVTGDFSSAEICSAVTAPIWDDRMLGANKMISLPNKATWVVTANNPGLSKEIARRCIRIRIDPKMAQPWSRKSATFRHPRLREWTTENRHTLVRAILTMVLYWIHQGKPLFKETLGAFENWAGIMGGILESNGISGFMSNLHKMYAETDQASREWCQLASSWWEIRGGRTVGVYDIMEIVDNENLLGSVLTHSNKKMRVIDLEKALRAQRGIRIGKYVIESYEDPETYVSKYQLVFCEGGEGSADGHPVRLDQA